MHTYRFLVCLGLSALWLGLADDARAAVPDGVCRMGGGEPDPPAYYAIDLVPTKQLRGLGRAKGMGYVTFARSPFGVALSPDGRYVYDLTVRVEHLKPRRDGVFVAWVTTRDLSEVRRLGPLDGAMTATGRVDWNKFIVVLSFEPTAAPTDRWTGPVVMRGLSRSGLMHTMAGHGPFQQDPCATYGY